MVADLMVVNINQKIPSVNEIKQTQSQQKTEIHSLIQNLNVVKDYSSIRMWYLECSRSLIVGTLRIVN